jgi:nitroimidazol reductase NimA-like FMN-containing flavoprotein (pyridoxamine 5'-phosphate oxidase superfamily)
MTGPQPSAELDTRFSDPDASPTSWQEAASVLDRAELYWLTTVRADGRPHVTPLIGVWLDGAVHFCTGLREQKARNLEHRQQVALTTGSNSWAQGMDVVVEAPLID